MQAKPGDDAKLNGITVVAKGSKVEGERDQWSGRESNPSHVSICILLVRTGELLG